MFIRGVLFASCSSAVSKAVPMGEISLSFQKSKHQRIQQDTQIKDTKVKDTRHRSKALKCLGIFWHVAFRTPPLRFSAGEEGSWHP